MIFALVIAVASVGAAFFAAQERQWGNVALSLAVAVGVAAFIFFTKSGQHDSGTRSNCHTEWDGVNNPTVCD